MKLSRTVTLFLSLGLLITAGCTRDTAKAPETREARAASVLLKSLRLPVKRARTRYHRA